MRCAGSRHCDSPAAGACLACDRGLCADHARYTRCADGGEHDLSSGRVADAPASVAPKPARKPAPTHSFPACGTCGKPAAFAVSGTARICMDCLRTLRAASPERLVELTHAE